MEEIRHYDAAAARFYHTQNLSQLPMASWDFYAMYFKALNDRLDDLNNLAKIAKANTWAETGSLHNLSAQDDTVIVVTDADLKIVYATKNMVHMNGYRPDEVIGKRPTMFQGRNTSKKTIRHIGESVRSQKPFETVILNYRKDGTPYNCWIKAAPTFNSEGKVVNFIAIEREVA